MYLGGILMRKRVLALFTATCIALSSTVMAYADPPDKPNNSSSSSSSISYSGANTITSSTTLSSPTYSSTTGSENALLVSGGTSTITDITVTKSGDADDESSDFYGTNAAVLVYNGATLNIEGGTVTTAGSHANGVFAYGEGTINISDATITTTNNNSGGVMVTGGGTLNAEDLTVSTAGGSSASIRSDRGGGTLTVTGGNYSTSGTGSPAVYSTADVTVNDATLTSTASEGIVVEGANSATLNNVTLTDTNSTLNGNSTTYKNIFLYQSMSGDADEGTAAFSSSGSNITTNKGDTFYITNTVATVDLEDTTFVNNDSTGAFLRVEAAAWGTSGSNGGDVTLTATNQDIEGDIVVDDISTLTMSMSEGSTYSGTINGDNEASSVDLTLDSTSVLALTGDSYVSSLTDSADNYSNINLNGYTLYIDGTAVTTTGYSGSVVVDDEEEIPSVIYFANTSSWSTVYAYMWNSSTVTSNATWPGEEMSYDSTSGYYYISTESDNDYDYIIFTDGSSQTDDLEIPTSGANLYALSSSAWSTYTASSTAVVDDEEEALVNNSFISQEAVVGQKVVFKGAATGGSGEYEYAYYYKKTSDTSWTTAGTEWGTSIYATAKPGTNTVYDVCIKVRDANNTSNIVKKYLTFAANTTETSLKCYGTVYKTIYKYGITNYITASSAGNADESTVQYKFEYRKASSNTYETIQDYSEDTQVSWDAPQTGSFTLRITAYDGTDYAVRTINIKVKPAS